jgi:hypothetical protein
VETDVENLLTKVSGNLPVRRAFGTAYEEDRMLVIPVAVVAGGGGAGTGHPRHRDRPPVPISGPSGDSRDTMQCCRTQGASTLAVWGAGAHLRPAQVAWHGPARTGRQPG